MYHELTIKSGHWLMIGLNNLKKCKKNVIEKHCSKGF